MSIVLFVQLDTGLKDLTDTSTSSTEVCYLDTHIKSHQEFLINLLQRTFTKFFNRHGLIVVKYGATLREMRFAIQA